MNDFFEKVACANPNCDNVSSKGVVYEKQGSKYFCSNCQFNEISNRARQDINTDSYEQQALVMQIAEKEKQKIQELIIELRNERNQGEDTINKLKEFTSKLVEVVKQGEKLKEDLETEIAEAKAKALLEKLKEVY